MIFKPTNGQIEIRPIEMEGFVSDASGTFEEKGEVISLADDLLISNVPFCKVGDVVYFDSWVSAKFPDEKGEIRYLIPAEYVRAIETME